MPPAAATRAAHDREEKIEFLARTLELTVVALEVDEARSRRQPRSVAGTADPRLARGHHGAFGVRDVGETMERVGARGVRPLDERPRHGSMGSPAC
ncbi:hypothetical protein [Streptosporangium saharense]|uniref:hypothetical protein n=1 Tax=Streptosporangium saharense TaxID=1706840 RepID=UPI0033290909